MLADTYAQAYLHAMDAVARSLDDAEKIARRAVGLDPTCQVARHALAFVHFLRKRRAAFLREAGAAITLNPNNVHVLGSLAYFFTAVGEYDRGLELVQRAMRLKPHYPGWYLNVPFMIHYFNRDYGAALALTERFMMPEFYGDHFLRAAVLGQLGRHTEATEALEAGLELRPNFRKRYRELLHRAFFSNEHVEMVLEGCARRG